MATDGVPFTATGQLLLPASERLLVREKNVEIKIENKTADRRSPHGVAYLTDQRIIFQADKRETFTSIAIPLVFVRTPQLQQPVFGANYVEADILSFAGGSIPPDGAHVKMWFKDGGAVAFGSQLMRLVAAGPQPPMVQATVPVQYLTGATGYPAAYPPPGMAYPPPGMAYPPPGMAYPPPAGAAYLPPAMAYGVPPPGPAAYGGQPQQPQQPASADEKAPPPGSASSKPDFPPPPPYDG